jgi:glycosyltransferase involved in cell wall biosynthesis
MARKIRIVHINPDMDLGGIQRHLAGTIPHLLNVGIEPIIVSAGGRLVERVERDGARHIWAPVDGKSPIRFLKGCNALTEIFRRECPDIVRAHAFVPCMAARRAMDRAGLRGVPLLASIHRSWVEEFKGMKRVTVPFIYPLLDRASDHIVAVCKPFKEGLKARGINGDKITVIENGISPEIVFVPEGRERMRKEIGIKDTDVSVGFLARLTTQKQPHDLIAAAPKIIEGAPNAVFTIAGDGPLRPAMERHVASLGLTDRFHFLGGRTDVPEVLSSFDVFVMPSRWEGFPNALLEAMACGRPCVVTAVMGNTEIAAHEQNALLVPLNDPPALADAVLRLIADGGLADRLGATAAQWTKERFSVARTVERTLELYIRLVENGMSR